MTVAYLRETVPALVSCRNMAIYTPNTQRWQPPNGFKASPSTHSPRCVKWQWGLGVSVRRCECTSIGFALILVIYPFWADEPAAHLQEKPVQVVTWGCVESVLIKLKQVGYACKNLFCWIKKKIQIRLLENKSNLLVILLFAEMENGVELESHLKLKCVFFRH